MPHTPGCVFAGTAIRALPVLSRAVIGVAQLYAADPPPNRVGQRMRSLEAARTTTSELLQYLN